ncbi:MAG: T9SS type A sorting domain-containing protein [Bacteroidales bacterium]|nr:T9SS type A sorting domain-containing protein [Bacteroidales bacterium]
MKTHYILRRVLTILCFLVTFYNPASAQNSFKAVADTIDLYPLVPIVFNLLSNDTLPAGDTISFIQGYGSPYIYGKTDTNFTTTFYLYAFGCQSDVNGTYKIHLKSGNTLSAPILFRIHDQSTSYLDINNVRARFNASGLHFSFENTDYEVPKGSGKTSLFSNSLWIGGKDEQHQLHFAGEKYGQGTQSSSHVKHDYFPGPKMDSLKYENLRDTVWNYIWNLKKSEIDYHRAHFWEAGYTPIHDILTWPGNGDTALGQAHKLAPFSDRNADGIYDPYDGDYPEIRGDQALFFIFNDDKLYHSESTGKKLGVEIHGMAYGFDLPNDSAFKNTIFLQYKLYNRSQNTYDSTLLGVFSDIDLGYANDDYLGCDVERNMYFGYNGTPVDGSGQSYAYGENPPAQSVIILGGPYMDPDYLDNPRYDLNGNQLCDFSVNGLNFGDSIVDNERFGLQRFWSITNMFFNVNPYPTYADDYYRLLSGKWQDGTSLIYGGNGHPTFGGYGPACNFMFPGESDTLNWGVGCAPPNGPVNWTETTAGNNPEDRRGVGVTGPFTFKPGDVQEIDIAFTWARDYVNPGPLASVDKLRLMVDQINKSFVNNKLPNGDPIYGINAQHSSSTSVINIYPNPSSDQVNIDFGNEYMPVNTTLELMTSHSNCIKKLTLSNSQKSVVLNLSDVPSGFYFIRITAQGSPVIKKVVVIH